MNREVQFPFMTALRETWQQGYKLRDFKKDCFAGLSVTIIAIPLGIALAVAAGATPVQGLYTIIIGAPIIALLGGSRLSVSGPTAAFIIILYPIVEEFGIKGLLLATFMAGIILVCMGLARLGRFVEFIPYPVTVGFTSGIAVVIASLQIKDFFGLAIETQPASFIERITLLINKFSSFDIHDTCIGVVTLLAMIIWPRFKISLPSHLIAVLVGIGVTISLIVLFPDLHIETIGTRFNGIPQTLPGFSLPWDWAITSKIFEDLRTDSSF